MLMKKQFFNEDASIIALVSASKSLAGMKSIILHG